MRQAAVHLTAALLVLTATTHAQWQLQTSNTSASLRGIVNVGSGIAWASGTEGTVLHTTDDGAHWQPCPTPRGADHLDFRGIQAFDAKTAIVMSSGKGDLSRLYKTTDACQTWHLVFTNPDKEGFWDAIQFSGLPQSPAKFLPYYLEHANGVLVGDPVMGVFAIFTTANGGQTWVRWNINDPKHFPKAKEGESLFAASNQAAVAPGNNGPFALVTGGREPSIYVAQPHSPFDNGVWFSLSSTALRFPTGQSAGAFAMAARRFPASPFANFMVVGGDYHQPNNPGVSALVSGPRPVIGGSTVSKPQTPPHGYRSSVAYDPTHKTWITVGPNGTDISTDDGRNWTPFKPDPKAGDTPDADRDWNALSLPFVVGPHGRIGKLRPEALPSSPNPKR